MMEELRLKRRKIRTSLGDAVEAKWSRAVLDEGFVPFPKRLLRCMAKLFESGYEAEDIAVVLSVADYKRKDLQRLPSVRYLAWNAGLSTDTFVERLKSLEERELLKRRGPDEEIEISLHGLEKRVEELTPEEEF